MTERNSRDQPLRRTPRGPNIDPDDPALRRVEYVVDSNVMLDSHSMHDFGEAVRDAEARGVQPVQDAIVNYRRARARDAILLALHFDRNRTTTFSFIEAFRLLEKRSPPWSEENPDMERLTYTAYTTDFAHFVLPRFLSGWDTRFTEYDPDLEQQTFDPVGDDADIALVQLASDLCVPLISNEGHKRDGSVNERKLVVREAKRLEVKLLQPRDVFAGALDEETAARDFLRGFEDAIPAHVASRAGRDKHDSAEHNLRGLARHFRLILLGEEEGSAGRWPL